MAGVLTAAPYAPELRPAWDALVDASRSAHFFHRRAYVEYHADRFEDASLVLLRDGSPWAALPASRHGDTVVSHGGLTFGGLLFGPRAGASAVLGAMGVAAEHLAASGARRLLYRPAPHIYHRVPGEEDLYALFRLGARLSRRDLAATVRLDARLPYAKGRRWSLRRAGERGLALARSTDFEAFMAVERETLARHGAVPAHTAEELALLAGRFPAHIRLHVAREGDGLLAGVVVYATPRVAHAQYIGATEAGRSAGALDVLLDSLLDAYAPTHAWFDFGISTEAEGRRLNEGLQANKESYGARGIAYDHYTLDL